MLDTVDPSALLHQVITVAVWWGAARGYGTPEEAQSLPQAFAKAATLAALGYGGGDSEIHIIQTTRKVCKYVREDANERELLQRDRRL